MARFNTRHYQLAIAAWQNPDGGPGYQNCTPPPGERHQRQCVGDKTALQGDIEIVHLLLENGADINAQGDSTALQCASAGGCIDIVRLLLENGADVNAPGGGKAVLQCGGCRPKIVRFLLENDVEINAQRGGMTALQCASADGHLETVRFLLENGALARGQIEIGRLLSNNEATASDYETE